MKDDKLYRNLMNNSMKVVFLFSIIFLVNCSSVVVTTANTTAPVLVGPVKKIKAKPSSPIEGKEFDFDRSMNSFYFVAPGSMQTADFKVDINEFDGEIMSQMDTTQEYAEAEIYTGSYSMLNIIFGAYHKTWTGIEGKIVKKDKLK